MLAVLVACPLAGVAQTPAVGADAGDIPGQWRIVGTHGGAVGWDASTLERDTRNDAAFVTALTYSTRPQSRDGITWTATVDDVAFQCADNLWTAYGIMAVDEDGVIVDEGQARDDWSPVLPDTPMSVLKLVACDGMDPPDAQEALDLDRALGIARSVARPAR